MFASTNVISKFEQQNRRSLKSVNQHICQHVVGQGLVKYELEL